MATSVEVSLHEESSVALINLLPVPASLTFLPTIPTPTAAIE